MSPLWSVPHCCGRKCGLDCGNVGTWAGCERSWSVVVALLMFFAVTLNNGKPRTCEFRGLKWHRYFILSSINSLPARTLWKQFRIRIYRCLYRHTFFSHIVQPQLQTKNKMHIMTKVVLISRDRLAWGKVQPGHQCITEHTGERTMLTHLLVRVFNRDKLT